MRSLKPAAFCLLLASFTVALSGQNKEVPTAQQVIETIIKQVGIKPIPNTVDVIKAGDPAAPVTGIVTTMFATMDVLKKAVALNCNLIICHEPVFYNHRDDTKPFENDPVYLEKKKYIDDHKLVIWRFHDYIHSLKPDAIDYGMALKLGWLKYTNGVDVEHFRLPETTLEVLVQSLRKIFPENTFHVIGNPEMKLTKVSFSAGSPGSAVHYTMLRGNDVVIAGETVQWETYEYVRDAVIQGKNKAIIFLGHVISEEPGMEYCAEWLKGFVKDIPIKYVESGPSFRTD